MLLCGLCKMDSMQGSVGVLSSIVASEGLDAAQPLVAVIMRSNLYRHVLLVLHPKIHSSGW
jgi:spore maturation protein SpmB